MHIMSTRNYAVENVKYVFKRAVQAIGQVRQERNLIVKSKNLGLILEL